jgi:hypothetical protein
MIGGVIVEEAKGTGAGPVTIKMRQYNSRTSGGSLKRQIAMGEKI